MLLVASMCVLLTLVLTLSACSPAATQQMLLQQVAAQTKPSLPGFDWEEFAAPAPEGGYQAIIDGSSTTHREPQQVMLNGRFRAAPDQEWVDSSLIFELDALFHESCGPEAGEKLVEPVVQNMVVTLWYKPGNYLFISGRGIEIGCLKLDDPRG